MKKILVILILFVLCINIFAINSFGKTSINFSDNITYDLPDFDEYVKGKDYCILYGKNNVVGTRFILLPYNSDNYKIRLSEIVPNEYSLQLFPIGAALQSFNALKYDYYYITSVNSSSWSQKSTSDNSGFYFDGGITAAFSTQDLLDLKGNIIFSSSSNPSFITTKEELSSANFDTLKIDAGKFDYSGDEFGLVLFDASSGVTNLRPLKTFVLNYDSIYGHAENLQMYYDIPRQDLGIDFSNGRKYVFTLSTLDGSEIYNTITFEVGGLTTGEEVKNKQDLTNSKIDEQTNAIKEQTETNKNIFEKIGDILSYINPFSENFFVYKLIELLVDAIKSLFIPSDDFFDSYFTDLKDWFSDRLGFLFYPFEIVIDILTKILNINFANPVFNIPDLYEPFTNTKIMSATTFDLNSLVQSGALKTIHDIYLFCVDAFIIFELVNLFRRKYEEVTTK